MTYVALHEETWRMVVWCTQNAPRQQRFDVAPALSALEVNHFSGCSKRRCKKLVTVAESYARAARAENSAIEKRSASAATSLLKVVTYPEEEEDETSEGSVTSQFPRFLSCRNLGRAPGAMLKRCPRSTSRQRWRCLPSSAKRLTSSSPPRSSQANPPPSSSVR